MAIFTWSAEKNKLLIEQRRISFEEVVLNIQLGNELDIFEHPNQNKYPGQRVSVVNIRDYIYLVPFIESDDEVFLKTIIPSRKATKQYLGMSHE